MPINNSVYPFDPTGSLSSNKITGEQHIITPVNYKDYNFIVPKLAPFFATNIVLSYKDVGGQTIPLVENVDYYLTHWFISASRACSKPIYGSITLLNNNLSGVLTLTYQTLGGDWNIDDQLIAQILADQLHNPRTTSWDSVSEMPYSFPVIDHAWDLVDMVGMSEVVAALEEIRTAIITGGDSTIQAHIDSRDNPHGVTAEQVNAYTKQAIDIKLAAKLGTGGTAYDSSRFGGKVPQDFIDEILAGTISNSTKFDGKTYSDAKTDILTGTSANSEKFNGMDMPAMTEFIDQRVQGGGSSVAVQHFRDAFNSTETDSWTPIATIEIGDITVSPNLSPSQVIISGGESLSDNTHIAYLVTFEYNLDSNDDLVSRHGITTLTGNINGVTIGTTLDTDSGITTATVWLKSDGNREKITTTVINSSGITLIKESGPFDGIVSVEPLGIEYISNDPVPYVTRQQFVDFIVEMTDLFQTLSA